MAVVRVLLADDQALIRAGFRSLLGAEADIEIVAEAADGSQAVAAASRCCPDVALMDIQMPVLDGIDRPRAPDGSAGAGCGRASSFRSDA